MHLYVDYNPHFAYFPYMKTINQKMIADFVDVSEQLICDIKQERRTFGKKTARRIAELTGIPYDIVAFGGGNDLLKKLRFAYQQQRGER